MKRAWVWVALVLSLGINVGVFATIGLTRLRSRARWEHVRPGGPPDMGRLADHLRLTGAEREQFLDIQRRFLETASRQRQDLEALRAELRRELSASEPDSSTIEELLGRSGQIYQSLDRALVESILASRELLTAEQRQRYFRILSRMRGGATRQGPPNHHLRRPR